MGVFDESMIVCRREARLTPRNSRANSRQYCSASWRYALPRIDCKKTCGIKRMASTRSCSSAMLGQFFPMFWPKPC